MNGIQNKGENQLQQVGNKEDNSTYRGDLILRAAAFGLTVGAAVVMATAKQTTTVSVQVSDALLPLKIPVTAKWHYLSDFLFFVVANAIGSAYAAISLLLTLLFLKKGSRASLFITIADILLVALLFSGNGAASAVGLLGREGNSHVHWNKVCNIFDGFCKRVMSAIILSILASLSFFLLSVGAVLGLRPTIRANH